MNDITKYTRELRRKYNINLLYKEDTIKLLEKDEKVNLKREKFIEKELENENDKDKKLKLEIHLITTQINTGIIKLKKNIINALLDYQKDSSKLSNLLVSLNKDAKSLNALIKINNSLTDIEFINFINKPFSDEYIYISDTIFNIRLLFLNGNKPFDDDKIDSLIQDLIDYFNGLREEINKDVINNSEKLFAEVKEEKQNIKVNGFRRLSCDIENLINNINQKMEIKSSLKTYGLAAVNYLYSDNPNTIVHKGDLIINEFNYLCKNNEVSNVIGLDTFYIKELLNEIEYYDSLQVTLSKFNANLPNTFEYGNKTYSTLVIKNKLDNIITALNKKINLLDDEFDKTNFDKYKKELLKMNAEKKSAEFKNEPFIDLDWNLWVSKEAHDEFILAQNEDKTNIVEVSDEEIAEYDRIKKLYNNTQEERINARREYFKSKLFLNDISFLEFLNNNKLTVLAEIEIYLKKLLDDIYSKYEQTNHSITFEEFLTINPKLGSMVDLYTTPLELSEFIKSKKEIKNKVNIIK